MTRLVELVKLAGPSTMVAEEFAALERRQALVQTTQPVTRPSAIDEERLHALLSESRARVWSEMLIARQMLPVLFPNQVVVTPDADLQHVELRAEYAVGRAFEGLFVPQTVVTPAGLSCVV